MDGNQSQSLVRHHHHNGIIKLPPGFRFHPTDEELVLQYLRRKVLSYPLPASIIPEIDLHKYNPWDLPGGREQEKYFFTPREPKYPNGNRANRATECGYWKATGKDRAIVASKINKVVGMKKALVFYQGKAPNGSRTDWIMHEYRLAIHGAELTKDWVLCRVFMKKRAGRIEEENGAARFIDFFSSHSGSCSDNTSCVTNESCSGEDVSSSYP